MPKTNRGGELHENVVVATKGYVGSASFTPANTSHVTPDVVGGAKEFALATPSGEKIPSGAQIRIVSAQMRVDGGTNETSTWRLHLYNVTPPSALADDATHDVPSGDRASYLGYFDFAQLIDLGSTLYIEATVGKQLTLLGTSLFGYLVNLTTVTTAAVARVVTLQVELI